MSLVDIVFMTTLFRKNNSAMKSALETVVVPMYCSAAKVAGQEEMEKLSKLITLWTSKNKFFSEETLDAMKNPGNSLNKYKTELTEKFRSAVEEVYMVEKIIRLATDVHCTFELNI